MKFEINNENINILEMICMITHSVGARNFLV
jgi:hypothetical protein